MHAASGARRRRRHRSRARIVLLRKKLGAGGGLPLRGRDASMDRGAPRRTRERAREELKSTEHPRDHGEREKRAWSLLFLYTSKREDNETKRFFFFEDAGRVSCLQKGAAAPSRYPSLDIPDMSRLSLAPMAKERMIGKVLRGEQKSSKKQKNKNNRKHRLSLSVSLSLAFPVCFFPSPARAATCVIKIPRNRKEREKKKRKK